VEEKNGAKQEESANISEEQNAEADVIEVSTRVAKAGDEDKFILFKKV